MAHAKQFGEFADPAPRANDFIDRHADTLASPTCAVKREMLVQPNHSFLLSCDDPRMRTDDSIEPRSRPDPRIGAAIRAKRKMLRLSQRKLADAISRSRSHLSNVERGEDGAGAEMLVKLSKELDLSLDELLKSPARGTPGTHQITVTEEEVGVVVAIRGLPADLRAPTIKMLLRAGATPKEA